MADKAEKKVYDHEYMAYMNEQADLLSQIDGVQYDWNSPEQMEKRLLEGATKTPIKTPVKSKPKEPSQPRPKVRGSTLGWIVSGYDVD